MSAAVLYSALPVILAGVLHMLVVRRNWLPVLARPLDGGRRWRGRRLLGDHKTWRGLLFVPAAAVALAALQAAAEHRWPGLAAWSLHPGASPLRVGLALGGGYVLAELPNSFWKRRRDLPPGAAGGPLQVLLDQADSALGCALACRLLLAWSLQAALLLVAAGTLLHLALNLLLHALGLRRRPV